MFFVIVNCVNHQHCVLQGAVITVAFSRTGNQFASGGADSQVGVS